MNHETPSKAPLTQGHRLPEALIRRSMRLSVFEGLAFAMMVGLGEAFFLADAIRLSASRVQQGLVVTLPLFIGSLGAVLALRVLTRLPSRKPLVVVATAAQALIFFGLALADASGASSAVTLLFGVCAYHVFGQAAGTAWSSWFGDLVPEAARGTYFAKRNRGIYLCTAIGLFAAGAVLNGFEPAGPVASAGKTDGGSGFPIIYALAGVFRLLSAALHVASPEPRFQRPTTHLRLFRFWRTKKGTSARRLLRLDLGFYFAVAIASPYFTPYMLEQLRFSYLEYTAATLVILFFKVAFLPVWGTLIDQFRARSVLPVCLILIAVVPLPWLWAEGLAWILVAQALSGLSWAGFELTLFCLFIDASHRSVRLHVFTLHNIFCGLAQLMGSMTGALVGLLWTPDLRVLFALSLAGRLLVALALPLGADPDPSGSIARKRDVLLRVVGIRPGGTITWRPLASAPAVIEAPASSPKPDPTQAN